VTGKAVLAGAALLAAACSAQAEAPPAITSAISYQAEIVPLLESNCATCHLTGEEAGGMSLVGDAAIGFLVGTPSQEAPALIRVVAGNPDKSYLVMKLEGTHISHGGSGAQMPFGAPPLAPEQIAKVRQWIAEGAKP
jgi:mono/diheme cytochrome c family protein